MNLWVTHVFGQDSSCPYKLANFETSIQVCLGGTIFQILEEMTFSIIDAWVFLIFSYLASGLSVLEF